MAKKIPERASVPEKDCWNLDSLFTSDDEWKKQYETVSAKRDRYDSYKGRISESVSVLKELLDFDMEISLEAEQLYTYAHLRHDEDTANQTYMGMYQQAVSLYTQQSEKASFIVPEIHSLDDAVLDAYLKDESLAEYGFYLEKIVREKPHTLSPEIESILARSTEMAMGVSQVFSQLNNADMTFGEIENEKGETVELSHGNFITFLMSPDAELRKKAFHQYYKTYDDHRNTLAASYAASVKKDCFYSGVRKFSDPRRSALFRDDVEDDVYDNLIQAVKDNLDPLFSYLDFRKKALGLDELHFYDTYVPLVKDVDFSMSYDEAVETCIKALAPLGEEYTSTLEKGLKEGWVDRYENKGKRSGAYSSGCYTSSPYILLNYEDKSINSLYTLIHEAGHSMHSYLSHKNQPYVNGSYTIFVAEVASTFNETLLSDYLMKKYADNRNMQAYIVNREIDNIRGTLIRQTMFAEFEKICHDRALAGEPLTLEVMRNTYRELLTVYFGDSIVIDEDLTLEGLRIPHFYSAFYVYKYATGISASIALAEAVKKGDSEAKERYLNFLKLGGSMFPLDELKKAGVDMSEPEPVQLALNHFGKLVKTFSEVYSEESVGESGSIAL